MAAPTASDIMARLDEIAATQTAILDRITAIEAAQKAPQTRASAPASGNASETLPNYGRRKGEPIRDCPIADLEYYASGCRRSLDDATKARWHDTERARLAAIEAEIARQTGQPISGATGVKIGPDDGREPGADDLPF